ncbi:WD repeat and SOCS box-containing protein 1-like [Mya arenaria]|uniref:WD repeat and SOCS box-containing protein 1-like n=1 Tax=Mya arenaria TaxID=6604 RepID=UPI0022E85028|nr:WD repeat and SOCS box-containing protein 1-like [Mya arenaria]
MTQDEGNPTSFYNAEPKDFGCVLKVDQVDAIFKSQYPENWSVAWAPDCSFVAWSQGAGIVYLLPWERHAGQILKKPTRNRSFENIAELVDEEAFINNLPRLVSDNSILDDDTERVKFCHQNDQQAAQCYRIDCMDIVWSMAFGGSHTEGSNIWRSYNSRCDLILATGLQGGKIKLWNVYCGNLLMELLDHKSIVRGLSFTCDGSFRLVSCSNDCTVKFWDLEDDGNMYKTVRFCEKTMVWGCKWSPNNKHVAAVGMQKKVYLWNADDLRKPALKLFGHHHSVASCDFSPDGALLATASFDTRVIVWDPYTGDAILSLCHLFPPPRLIYAGGANDHYVRDLSFSRDGQHIATVSDDGYIRIWDLHTGTGNPEWISETKKPLSCKFSPNGHVVAVGTRVDGTLQIYRPPNMGVTSLQHLCRLKIRHKLESKAIDHLPLPCRIKEFLKYRLP